jgi:hypothetical protein
MKFGNSDISKAAACVLALFAASSIVAGAQGVVPPPRSTMSAGAQQLLTSFENRAETGPASLGTLLRRPELYNKKVIDSVVVGLEKLALTSSSPSVRSNAAWNLAVAGSAKMSDPGVLDRLTRVYQRSHDELVRRSILGRMYQQQNKKGAIQFLMKVASQAPDQLGYEEAALEAVSGLSYMGDEGRAALLELKNSGRLKDPSAIGFANWFLTK